MPKLGAATPVLRVTDSEAARTFYCDQLGFTLRSCYRPFAGRLDPAYLVVTRDDARLHVTSFPGDGQLAHVTGIACNDVDALHAELVAKNVAIHIPPTDQTWGVREICAKDADGNSITFQQPL